MPPAGHQQATMRLMRILKSLLVVAGLIQLVAAQDYPAFPGSVYWSLDMGYDRCFGTIEKNEKTFVDGHDLQFYLTDTLGYIDTVKPEYDYSGFGGSLKVLFFRTERVCFGPSGSFNVVFQNSNAFDVNEMIAYKFNIGISGGYYKPTNSLISFFPNVSLYYTHALIFPCAVLSTIETANADLQRLIKENSGEIAANGLSSTIDLRIMLFPFSGRFFCYVGGAYEFSFMIGKGIDTDNFANNYLDHRVSFKVGAGYLTE